MNMKVYVLYYMRWYDESTYTVLGVFSSRKSANEALEKGRKERGYIPGDGYEVKEYTVLP